MKPTIPTECSIIGCQRKTFLTRWPDPRNRWLLGIELTEEDGSVVRVNLCPWHAREQFQLQEHDYAQMERMESMVTEGRAN